MKLLCIFWLSTAAENLHAQMTPAQSVQLSYPSLLAWSPSGVQFVFAVKRAMVSTNKNQFTVYLAGPGMPAQALFSVDRLGLLAWAGNDNSLVYVAKGNESIDSYQIWTMDVRSRLKNQITHHPDGIAAGAHDDDIEAQQTMSIFRVSPNGRKALFYVRDKSAAESQLENVWNGFFQYGDDRLVTDVISSDYAWKYMPAAAHSIWLVDFDTREQRVIWRSESEPRETGTRELWFDWSPDGERVAIAWPDVREKGSEKGVISILDSESFRTTDRVANLRWAGNYAWSADSKRVVFDSLGPLSTTNEAHHYAQYSYVVAERKLAVNATDAIDGEQDRISESIRRALGKPVRSCTQNKAATHIACIREDATTPPEIILYDSERASGRINQRWLTNLHGDLAALRFGEVKTIKDLNGHESGIVLPVGFEKGKRYPLVVMQYNLFTPDRFTGATGFSSYSPQVFAAKGYVVLLQNLPNGWNEYGMGNFVEARQKEADGIVRSLKSMIDQLIADGMVDSSRMGLMGWSFGGFLTPYIQTHYPGWFQAAAAGDGANHEPAFYWLGDDQWRAAEDRYFGKGGPDGPNANNWRDVAPTFNADKLVSPILLEYSAATLAGISLYRSIRDHGGIAELYVYRNEKHVFDRPANQLASMERHFDWFNFWLLNETDPAIIKRTQYNKWRILLQRRDSRPLIRERGSHIPTEEVGS